MYDTPMTKRADTRLDPESRRGYIARISDIERLDEKVDAIEEIAPELLLRQPSAVR